MAMAMAMLPNVEALVPTYKPPIQSTHLIHMGSARHGTTELTSHPALLR
jgi:hypothetical protein